MQVTYSLVNSLIPANSKSLVEVLLSFKGETTVAATRRPLNLSLVIDRSGSMAGEPLRQAISAAQKLVEQLTDQDYLSVVIYDDTVATIVQPQQVRDRHDYLQERRFTETSLCFPNPLPVRGQLV